MRLIKLFFTILLGFLLTIVALAINNIPTITISRQSQLDSLTTAVFDGNLIINGPDISNLDNLYRLTSIKGFFEIRNNPLLTNFDGLSHLDSVAGNFVIHNNINLVNINGLSNLNFIGGDLKIDSDYALLNIDGLSKIDLVRGGLTIVNNPALANINGLSNLRNIMGELTIDSDYVLLDIGGLSRIDSIGGGISIKDNLALKNIDGLSKIDSVRGGLTIVNNPVLANINGLSNLRNIRGGLAIDSNHILLNIDALSHLAFIGGRLTIDSNAALENLSGLSNLNSVNGNLSIQNNVSLTEFCGLYTVLSGSGLSGSYSVAGNKNNPSEAEIISGGACNSQSSIDAVIFAANSIWFEAASRVHSGNIIVNDVSGGPTLDAGVELSVGVGVQTSADNFLKANRIKVKFDAYVKGDVYFNQLSNQGHITGTLNHPLSLPVYSVLPPFHQHTPGSQNITVPRNGSAIITAGTYQDVAVRTRGTLIFKGGGTFAIRNLNTENKVKLIFDQPSEVLISKSFDTDVNCYVGPVEGSSIDASDIIFYVAGINGNDGKLNSFPKSAKIGLNNKVFANFYVPNGTLWLAGLTSATGAFIAKDVRVGLNVDVYEKSAFEGNIAPKVTADNPARNNIQTDEHPKTYMLSQNFPNPFNPSTTIKYALPENEKVTIEIYDLLGRKVAELVNGEVEAGYHEVKFNAGNLASGIYFYRLSAGSFNQVNKMLLMK
ncbi:MAG: T9SS type A sorting domain-containing protein [Ignavibacteriaceae bacterium]